MGDLMGESALAPASPSGRTLLQRLALPMAVAAVVAVALGWGLWWPYSARQAPPPDPRLSYAGPFQNIHPSVRYVGDEACAGCHQSHLDSFAKHPMGQAMAWVEQSTPIERHDAAANNPFTAGGFRYTVGLPGQGGFHREERPAQVTGQPVGEFTREMKAIFAIGSGAKGRSYMVEQDGYLFESPCTWYQSGQVWNLSPGYLEKNQHFSRPVSPACLFCHCNQVDHMDGTLNRYRQPVFHGLPIGCERCHGPGEKHVAARLSGDGPSEGMDTTIVNPKWLDHSLRQAVCEQCHLQGDQRVTGRGLTEFDFRPGLPLQDFLMDFVDGRQADGSHKFVHTVEQMRQSQCYLASPEPARMGCTSCHDPHSMPENPQAKLTHYRARCLVCHAEKPCALPEPVRLQQQPGDSCVACHMPQTGVARVNHAALTDHTIPRLPVKTNPASQRPRPFPSPYDLVPFHSHLITPDDPGLLRNLGLARMAMLNLEPPLEMSRDLAAAALPNLDAAVRLDPQDWPAVEARADALFLLDRPNEAMPEYQRSALALPGHEKTRFGAGLVALELGRREEAIAHFRAAVAINPHHPGYQHQLAVALLRDGDAAGAVQACLAGLKTEPSRVQTRSLLLLALLRQGKNAEALDQLRLLRELTTPAKHADLNRWFTEEQEKARKG